MAQPRTDVAVTEVPPSWRHRLPPIAVVVVTVFGLLWSVQGFWDPKADAARYILVARSLLRGQGFTVFGEAYTVRPPGMSILLVPVLWLRGLDFGALNACVGVFGSVAAITIFFLLKPRIGDALALVVALLVWLDPEFQRLANGVMSDVPGLALALLALASMSWCRSRWSLGRSVVVGLAIACAVYLRTANLALLPAWILERACSRRPPTGKTHGAWLAVPLVVVALAYGPWLVHAHRHPTRGDQAIYSYTAAYLKTSPADPAGPYAGARLWVDRVRANVPVYVARLASGLERSTPTALDWTICAAILCCWWLVLWRRRSAVEWFAGISFAIVAVWHAPVPRLVLPVWVLSLGAVAEVLLRGGARLFGGRRSSWPALVCLLVWQTPQLRYDFTREGSRADFESLEQALEHVRLTTTPADRLGGDLGAAYAVLLDRPVEALRSLRRGENSLDLVEVVEAHRLRVVILRRDKPGGRLEARARALGKDVLDFGPYAVIHW